MTLPSPHRTQTLIYSHEQLAADLEKVKSSQDFRFTIFDFRLTIYSLEQLAADLEKVKSSLDLTYDLQPRTAS